MTVTSKDLLNLALSNEDIIRDWVSNRPTYKNRTYDNLISDIKSNKIRVNVVPDNEWAQHLKNNPELSSSSVGYYSGDVINLPQRRVGTSTVPHELLHYLSGHRENEYGVPKINPYIKADMYLKGWLPSFHPHGRRPTLPGDGPLSQWWNQNLATTQTKYSDKNKYHPWYDEHAYDTTADKMLDNQRGSDQPIRYDKNKYPVYQKQSKKAQAFREAFRKARGKNLSTFEWDDRKYTTELA
mgnify:CR=1 FL=1